MYIFTSIKQKYINNCLFIPLKIVGSMKMRHLGHNIYDLLHLL